MKYFFTAWLMFIAGADVSFGRVSFLEPRRSIDSDWRFHLGDEWGLAERLDKAGQSIGPAATNFSDAGWRAVDLPHDWAIELPFDSTADTGHGFKPIGPGFHSNNIGWYRRTFTLPVEDKGKRLTLEFGGVFRDCRVFVNGFLIGHHESGYNSFHYDITDAANCGGTNVIAVRVDASEFEGWFYEGAGIYRHVWLVKTSPLAIEPDGIFVYSKFPNNIPNGEATVCIETTVKNNSPHPAHATASWKIPECANASPQEVNFTAWEIKVLKSEVKIQNPALWSPESPALYHLYTSISTSGETDIRQVEFGIRTVAFDATNGFLLNGYPYTIKGTCNHQDHAGVGIAVPDALQEFRARRLKDMGGNAVRTSHNEAAEEWITACDHLGLLVMDENRLLGSSAQNLELLEQQIKRDRNHPSVFIWSLFNEENTQGTAVGARNAATMQQLAHRLDPTRLCTAAESEGDVFEGVTAVLDVRGWNYHVKDVDAYRQKHASQYEIGTEQASALSTRGMYTNDKTLGYMSCYDTNAPRWGDTAEDWWQIYAARPWLSGGFVWTGFDYRGEPTPYRWPCISSHFGVLDTCGFAKDAFYYYKAWWGDRPVLHLFPHWNWPDRIGQPIDVWCYGNCDEVELLLNGQSLGRKTMATNSHVHWMVKYAPGTLAAHGFKNGQLISEDVVRTTGPAAAVKLKPDRISIDKEGDDVAIITVAVVDTNGYVVPDATNLIDFELTGPGRILGVGNGDPSSHEPDTFVVRPTVREVPLIKWRMKRVSSTRKKAEMNEKFDDSSWEEANAESKTGPLEPGENAIFRGHFEVSSNDLAGESATFSFGRIDDDGWVYVNGQLVGDSYDRRSHPLIEARRFLHTGTNTIAVAVRNRDGAGGLNDGVVLRWQNAPAAPQWSRSVFNGLAQILVRTKEPGVMHLTARGSGLAVGTTDIACYSKPQ